MTEQIDSGQPGLAARWRGRWELRDVAPLLTLAVLVVFFSFAAPNFLKLATLEAVLKQGSVLAVVAVGLTYVLICGEIDLAVGMMALWSACFCGWLCERWMLGPDGKPLPSVWLTGVVLLIPLASCLLLGFLSGLLTVWSRLPSFIISLAMMFITEGLARYSTRNEAVKIPALLATIGNEGISLTERFLIPYSAVIAALVFLLGHFVLRRTRFGRYVYATGGNRQAARLAGVRTSWIVVGCLALSALLAGLGGLLNCGRIGYGKSDQNKDLLLSAVAAVVVGGTSLFGGEGSMGKTVAGVLTFTVLNVGLMQINWIDDLARQLLTGLVLLAALVVNGVLTKSRIGVRP